MNMVVLIIVIILLIYPSWYGARHYLDESRKRKREKRLLQKYNEQMLKHKLSVEYADHFGNRIIALDRKNRKLLVVDHNDVEAPKEIFVPLLTISDTKIINKRNADGGIRKVLLELKNKRVGDIFYICFFDEKNDLLKDLPPFSRKAFFWKNRIDVNKYWGNVFSGHEFVL